MKDISMEGDLAYFNIVEIFYLLSRFRKTGRLIIKEKGSIYISNGKVLHAETDNSEGLEAFFSLSMLREGKFNFQPDEIPSVNTISTSLSDLMDEIEIKNAELEEFKKDLPPISTIPEKSNKAPKTEKVALKKEDWKLLILADGKKSLGEIIKASPLEELDTLKALSWLFKEELLYDPEEKKRIVKEGVEKATHFLEIFGEGPWMESIKELVKDYELEDTISLTGKKVTFLRKDFPLDLEKTKSFFNDVMNTLEEKATETLGKLLVKRKIKEIYESGNTV